NGRAPLQRRGAAEHGGKTLAEENIASENKASRIVADKWPPDNEGLRQTARGRLGGIGNGNPPGAAVAQNRLVAEDVLWRGYQQNVADSRQHQGRQRIIDHRLVVD